MSILELGDMVSFLSDATRIGEDLKLTEFLEDPAYKDIFATIKENYGENINFDSEGFSSGNTRIDYSKLNELYGNDTVNDFTPDLKTAYEKMGYTPDQINILKTQIDEQTVQLNNRPQVDIVRNIRSKGLKSVSDSTTRLSIESNQSSNSIFKSIGDQLKAGAKYIASNPGTVFKWLLFAVAVTVLGVVITDIVTLAENYQSAMNGCWILDTVNNRKFKVFPLTCDPNSRKPVSQQFGGSFIPNFSFATYCENQSTCPGINFNPMSTLLEKITPGPNLITSPPSNPVPGKYDQVTGLCTNYQYCVAPCNSLPSDGNPCPNCNNNNFYIPKGYLLYCANFSLAEALLELTGVAVSDLAGPFTAILQTLEYIGIGVAVVIGIVIVIKVIIWINGMGKKNATATTATIEMIPAPIEPAPTSIKTIQHIKHEISRKHK